MQQIQDIIEKILYHKINFILFGNCALLINLILSKLFKGQLSILITKDYIVGILGSNLLWFIVQFFLIGWLYLSRNCSLFKLNKHISPFMVIFFIIILICSIPMVWFTAMPFDIINFNLLWFIYFYAMAAEAENLEKYFKLKK